MTLVCGDFVQSRSHSVLQRRTPVVLPPLHRQRGPVGKVFPVISFQKSSFHSPGRAVVRLRRDSMNIQIPAPQSTLVLSRLLKSVGGEEALSDRHHHCRPIRVSPCNVEPVGEGSRLPIGGAGECGEGSGCGQTDHTAASNLAIKPSVAVGTAGGLAVAPPLSAPWQFAWSSRPVTD